MWFPLELEKHKKQNKTLSSTLIIPLNKSPSSREGKKKFTMIKVF